MFAYSFLAMTAYNVIKPLTRSKFITEPRAPTTFPTSCSAAGLIIGILMTGYAWLMARLPRALGAADHAGRHGGAMLVLLVPVPDRRRRGCRSPSTLRACILGVLLISQFWTLANVVYDPRQAKRLFGFVGGGAPLGGIAGIGVWRSLTPTDRHQRTCCCRARRR